MSLWAFTKTIQARVVKFALKRTLGPFFKQELSLDQLDVEVSTSKGTVTLRDIELSTDALNQLLEHLPFRVVSGVIRQITVDVSWESLWQASLVFTVQGTEIVLEFNPGTDKATADDVLSSVMRSSAMTSSRQIASEFLREDPAAAAVAAQASREQPQPQRASPVAPADDAGAVLTDFINRMLSRVSIKALDTTVVLRQKESTYSGKPNAVEINFAEISVKDESPEGGAAAATTASQFSLKAVSFSGLAVRFQEFHDRHALEDNSPAHNVLLLRIADKNFVKVKLNLQPTVNVTAPAYDLDCFIKNVKLVLAPHHLHSLLQFATAISDQFAAKPSDDEPGSPASFVSVDSARSRKNSINFAQETGPMGRTLAAHDFPQIDHILTMGSRSSTLRTSTSTVGTSRYVDARDDDDYDDDNRSNESLQSVDDDDEATTPASANASSSSVLASSSKESFGVSAAQPSVHLQVHLRQLSIILWTVDSLNRTSMESQWPYASTWHDDLLLDALSVDTETSLPSHVTVQVLNVAAEWTQSAIKMSTSVRLQTITVNEFLPDSVKDPKVAKYSPFVVEPFMPVLVFSSAIPVNTIAVPPTHSRELELAMVETGLLSVAGTPLYNASRDDKARIGSPRPFKSAMASGSAREPDVVIQIDTIAKGESGSTKVSVSMQPLLLTLDLRILDRLQHFIVAPVAPAPSPMEGEPDDYPPSAPVHRERGSPSSKTVVELKCSMIRLDVSTPRVIDDSMIPNFKPGVYLYSESNVVDLHDLYLETGGSDVANMTLDPSDIYLSFKKILVCLRAPSSPVATERVKQQYIMTAIALVDGGQSKIPAEVIVHTNNQLEIPDAVPTPDSAALMNKHKQNPSAFKSSAKRLAKMNVESTINRVVVHMSRSQFVKADLIFNEATEWLPQLAQTLALRALPSNDIVFEEVKSDNDLNDDEHASESATLSRSHIRSIRPATANVHMLTLVADISQLIFTIMEDPSDSEENYKRPNMYLIKVMEMRAFRVLQYSGSNLNFLHLTIDDASLSDISDPEKQVVVIARTSPLAAQDLVPSPVLDLLLTIGWDHTEHSKDICVDMNLSDLVLQHVSESSWMSVLPALLEEAPMEGLYAEFLHRGIKLDIGFNNVCAQFNPKYDSFSLVLEIVQGTFAAMIIVGSPTLGFNLNFENTRILLRDYDGSHASQDQKEEQSIYSSFMLEKTSPSLSAREQHWESNGFVPIVRVNTIAVYIRTGLESLYELKFGRGYVDTCADTFSSFVRAIDYLTNSRDLPPSPVHAIPATSTDDDDEAPKLFAGGDSTSIGGSSGGDDGERPLVADVFASVDELAFAVPKQGFVSSEVPITGAGYLGPSPPRHYQQQLRPPQQRFPGVRDATKQRIASMDDEFVTAFDSPIPVVSSDDATDDWDPIADSDDAIETSRNDPLLASNGPRFGSSAWLTSLGGAATTPSSGRNSTDLLSGSELRTSPTLPGQSLGSSAGSYSAAPATTSNPLDSLLPPVSESTYPTITTPEESQLLFGNQNAPTEYFVRVIDDEPLQFTEDHFDTAHTEKAGDQLLPEHSAFKLTFTVSMLCWRMYDGLDFRIPARLMRTLKTTPAIPADDLSTRARSTSDSSMASVPQSMASADFAKLDDEWSSDAAAAAAAAAQRGSSSASSSAAPSLAATKGGDDDDEEEDFLPIDHEDVKGYVDKRTASNVEMRAHWRFRQQRSEKAWLKVFMHHFLVSKQSYDPKEQVASHLVISVRDLRVRDLIRASVFRHFLTYWRPTERDEPRETDSVMLEYQSTSVRPNPALSNTETRLRLQVLPLRFYVDQHAVDFLIDFFSFSPARAPGPAGPLPPTPEPAVGAKAPKETFYQQVNISSVALKLDYMPEVLHWDSLLEGKLAELINLFYIEGSVVRLPLVKLSGLEGFQRVLEGVQRKWVPKLMDPRTTGTGIASGITVVGSFINLGSSLLDMIVLPVQHYRKDGRTMRGIAQGAGSLLKTVTVETINLSTKLVVGTQMVLVFANSALSASSDSDSSGQREFTPSFYAAQPANIREGAEQGLHKLQTNLGEAVYSAFTLPLEVYREQGAAASVRTAIRAIPTAMIKPLIGGVEAVGKLLLGIRNEVEPGQSEEADEKYKRSARDNDDDD